MRYFDTHAHIGLIYDDPIEQLLVCQQAKQVGVAKLVSICNSLVDFFQVYDNLKTAEHVYHAAGVSPSEVASPGRDWQTKLEDALKLPRVIAVGEIGLDYFHRYGDKDSQIELFIDQLDVAARHDLPVIIHNREAGRDVLDVLRDRLPPAGGVLHCYSEDAEYARRALDLNLYFSFAGNLTYRNARNLHDTVREVPLDRILVESEAPFMVPSKYRGKRNKPEYLPATVDDLAMLLDLPVEEVAQASYENACRFFRLPI
ncbi:MAG TPA: hydrolase TatD [Spirochaetaceae bacterium]|jgi:TatD DNase family protein|nr:hydrolase TatD [Spirochaetaceae bacterium]